MADWDSPSLLAKCKLIRRRPALDETTDADWYAMLTEAEAQWLGDIAAHVPREMVTGPTKMTSSDDGVTWSIPSGPDSVYAMLVMDALDGGPLIPGSFFDEGKDYAIERATTIRMVLNIARTFADGPWAFYIPGPAQIDANTVSRIQPPHLRLLLAYRACAIDASRGGRDDPSFYEGLEHTAAWGDGAGRIGMIPATKRKHRMSGRSAFPEVEGIASLWSQVF